MAMIASVSTIKKRSVNFTLQLRLYMKYCVPNINYFPPNKQATEIPMTLFFKLPELSEFNSANPKPY